MAYRSALLAIALLACAAASATSSGPAPADRESTWRQLYDTATGRYAAKDDGAAEQAVRQALAIARAGQGGSQPFIASSLNLLALLRQRQGHAEEAIVLFQQAKEASAHATGQAANTAAIALNLGDALRQSGRAHGAIAAYREGLDHIGPSEDALIDPTGTLASLAAQLTTQLARVLAEEGRTAESMQLNQQTLDRGSALPPGTRADALERQALLLGAQSQLREARRLAEQALALRDAEPSTNSAAILRSLGILSGLLDQAGQHDDALPLHRRAVALLEQDGASSAALAGHLNEIGLWHLARKEYAESGTLLARARALVMAQDPQGLQAARLVANEAQLLEAMQDRTGAAAAYRQALAIYSLHAASAEGQLGQAQALNFLAGQDYLRRRFAQAEPQYLQAIALTEQAEGAQSPRLLPLLDNLVALYTSQQRWPEAQRYADRADQVRKALSPDTQATFTGVATP